ncbi:MAG: flagellar basal body rod protein FlgB [Planctomycetota bacterium]|jgi:flagellar basal-body rod protein FlgB
MLNSRINHALEESVAFAERRHAILAGNLANMDTPGYKTRDLSLSEFQASLKDLMATEKSRSMPSSPGDRDVAGARRGGGALAREQAVAEVRDAATQVVYHDGSDDNLETQIAEIAKNQTMHSTAIALLKSQYRTMQMAIAGNVSV